MGKLGQATCSLWASDFLIYRGKNMGKRSWRPLPAQRVHDSLTQSPVIDSQYQNDGPHQHLTRRVNYARYLLLNTFSVPKTQMWTCGILFHLLHSTGKQALFLFLFCRRGNSVKLTRIITDRAHASLTHKHYILLPPTFVAKAQNICAVESSRMWRPVWEYGGTP